MINTTYVSSRSPPRYKRQRKIRTLKTAYRKGDVWYERLSAAPCSTICRHIWR